jgi:hypothetical protein
VILKKKLAGGCSTQLNWVHGSGWEESETGAAETRDIHWRMGAEISGGGRGGGHPNLQARPFKILAAGPGGKGEAGKQLNTPNGFASGPDRTFDAISVHSK